jgi:RNA polymerase-binding transcription factor DksA
MPASQELQKERLEAERERLTNELAQFDVAGRKNLGYSTHMADDASAAFDQARDLALRSSLEETLKQVEKALGRFDNGTYGTCGVCGGPIDPARLKALPYAPTCLGCQRRLEH